MKKTRRVELHIEHREISVFARAGATHVRSTAPLMPPAGELSANAACPVCGSLRLLLLAEAVSSPAIDLRALQQGMENGSLHPHRSPDGGWWICTEAFGQG